MRVTDTQRINIAQESLMATNTRLNKVYEQIATGRKLNHISDDPVAHVREQAMLRDIKFNEQFSDTMSTLQLDMSKYETHFNTMTEVSQRINELLIQAANGTNAPSDLKSYTTEIQSLKEELIANLNAKDGDRFIFSGTDSNVPAIDVNPPYAQTGNSNYRSVQVSDTVDYNANFTVNDALGATDILNRLDSVLAELNNPTASFDTVISDATQANSDLIDQFTMQLSVIGGRVNSLDRMIAANSDIAAYSEALKSEFVEVDFAEASITLNKNLMTLEASQKTFAQLIGNSLFDLL
ncbi:flagellar hook-associated protein 3 [Vibrio barjaei]|uniref:flagellin N-terminal helical domain-containing protein n=1 Tax=Vibrio barjaei TaxID=1676683 RepID=UPI00228373A8|nr:flagellar hook-associated protein 3 [Vibrio barjaei]MCY9872310.1 flagellar hook-associated protein 3 [Vibrio barjaei]